MSESGGAASCEAMCERAGTTGRRFWMARRAPARRPKLAGSERPAGGWVVALACSCRCARFLAVRREPAAPPDGMGRPPDAE
eukprot:6049472-Alexandrium_andersonii.AAC.1